MNLSRSFLLRIVISFAVGMLGAWLISEGSYLLLKNPETRDTTRRIEIVIPQGAAGRIAAGQEIYSIPANMTFVEGDLLVVKNEDDVSHQLGPVWVPPQTSGVLELGTANQYTYDCSFQASKVMGIEVLPALTVATRIQGILAMGLPSGVMLSVYSFLVFPLKPREEKPAEPAA